MHNESEVVLTVHPCYTDFTAALVSGLRIPACHPLLLKPLGSNERLLDVMNCSIFAVHTKFSALTET